MVITAAQLHSTKPELRFYAGQSPSRDVLEIHDGKDHWHLFRLERGLNAVRLSNIPQKTNHHHYNHLLTEDVRAERCDYELGHLHITTEWQNTTHVLWGFAAALKHLSETAV